MKPSTDARRARCARAAAVGAAVVLSASVAVAALGPGAAAQTPCASSWVQAGAFRSIDNATRFLDEVHRLAGAGVPVVVLVVPIAGLPMYRVVAGPLTEAAAAAVTVSLGAGGIIAARSTRTTDCPTAGAPGAPPPVTTSAGSTAGPTFRVQVGAFCSADYALRLADETQAKLGGEAQPGEISVIVGTAGGAPIHRVQSRAYARPDAEALLALVRRAQPAAGAVLVVS